MAEKQVKQEEIASFTRLRRIRKRKLPRTCPPLVHLGEVGVPVDRVEQETAEDQVRGCRPGCNPIRQPGQQEHGQCDNPWTDLLHNGDPSEVYLRNKDQAIKQSSLAIPLFALYNHFMSQSLDLYRLQRIDSQREKAASRIRTIEQILSTDLALQQAQNDKAAREATLQSARQKLKQAEDAVQSQTIKIEQNQAALYGGKVKNPKELQDLQNESSALKRYLSVLEDQQLDAMLALENAEQEYEKSGAILEQSNPILLRRIQPWSRKNKPSSGKSNAWHPSARRRSNLSQLKPGQYTRDCSYKKEAWL